MRFRRKICAARSLAEPARTRQQVRLACMVLTCCSVFGAFLPGLGGAAHASEPRIEAPSFPAPVQSFTAPVQTGVARCAKVNATGLYKKAPDPARDQDAAYCLGRRLPVLYDGAVFVRGVDDFYTGETVVWAGKLDVQGEPGAIPPPTAQAFAAGKPALTAVFRAEQDAEFQHNALKDCSPNWYFPKAFDIIGVRKDENGDQHPNPVKVDVQVYAPLASAEATLRIALNSNAVADKDNTLTVRLNGTALAENIGWKGPGYRVIELDFAASLLKDGANAVELLGDAVYIKYLDWVEIVTEAQPRLRDGSLVVLAKEDAVLALPGARYAVDITDFGAERAVDAKEGTFQLAAGRLYYFSDKLGALDFGPEIQLAEPNLDGKDYVCVGLRAMLSALDPLLQRKTSDGLHPACVAFEDVMNVYNGGMYGPDGVVTMLQRAKPAYVLLAAGFNRDCRDHLNRRAKDPDWHPGIPARMRQVEQLTVTDDYYTLDLTVKVGRVPVRTKEELGAWAAKAARHETSDALVLFAGQNKKADFSAYQRQYVGKVPAALLEAEGQPPEKVRQQLFDLMKAGSRLVIYQGHAQSWELDKELLDKSHAASMPESCWLLATCNAAYYHADYDVYIRDWMTAPKGGCVNAIASSSVGEDDQQDQVVRRFVENLLKNPQDDWGGMMQYLKKNLPLCEETMKDPNTPAFLRNSIPRDRKTIDAYSLLGDPAARVFTTPPRKTEFQQPSAQGQKQRQVLPPGPATLSLQFYGPWEASSFAEDRIAVQWRPTGAEPWRALALEAPLHPEANPIPFDSAALGKDGGVFELRVVERHPNAPETVWTTTRILQEGGTPSVPIVRIRKAQAKGPEMDTLECIARAKGPLADPKAVQTQFQVRDKSQPDKILEDTAWLDAPRYKHAPQDINTSLEIRARYRKRGIEGAWSEWMSLAPTQPDPGGIPLR